MADLIELAKQYVSVSTQLAGIRNAMRIALSNGVSGGDPIDENPPEPSADPGGKPKRTKKAHHPTKVKSRVEVMAASAALDEACLVLLKDKPMKSSEVARTTKAKLSSVGARLHRLRERGLIARDDAGLWSAA
jgi:hypothetical protein